MFMVALFAVVWDVGLRTGVDYRSMIWLRERRIGVGVALFVQQSGCFGCFIDATVCHLCGAIVLGLGHACVWLRSIGLAESVP